MLTLQPRFSRPDTRIFILWPPVVLVYDTLGGETHRPSTNKETNWKSLVWRYGATLLPCRTEGCNEPSSGIVSTHALIVGGIVEGLVLLILLFSLIVSWLENPLPY